MLQSWTLLFIHAKCNSLYLLTPNSQSILPLPLFPLAIPSLFSMSVSLFCMCVLSCVQLFATPGTAAHQVPLSVGISRQEYWSELPFPTPIQKILKRGTCLTTQSPRFCIHQSEKVKIPDDKYTPDKYSSRAVTITKDFKE